MFDPKIPYNDLPFLPPKKSHYSSQKIMKHLMGAKVALAELNALLRPIKRKDIFLESFALREAIESSQIENINTTVEEMYEAKYDGTISQAQKETLHYKEALIHGNQLIADRGFLSINDICSIGKVLSPKGEIRKISGVAIKKGLIGFYETIYTPPIGMNRNGDDSIQSLLRNLENFFNIPDKIDPLIKTALIHYQFESIHPFLDGNGRTGRILMILYLVLSGKLSYPALFLSGYINNHKSGYYKSLLEVTSNESWENYIIYILKAIESQSKKTSKNINKLIDYIDDVEKKLSKISEIKGKYAIVLKEIFSSEIFISVKDLERHLKVSYDTGLKIFDLLLKHDFGKLQNRKVGGRVILNKALLKNFTR